MEAFGRDPDDMEWACLLWMSMGDSALKARERARQGLIERYGDDAWEVVPEKGYLLGNDKECASMIARYREAGVTHFIVNSLSAGEEALEDFERFASDVWPSVQ